MKYLVLCMALSCSALAGEKTLHTPWSGSISAGYDSLYMFRGVNQLPGYAGYGSGISWTGLSAAWAPTETDIFSATTWMAFGLNDSNYKEMDLTLSYTRVWGDLSISAAYALYAVLSEALNEMVTVAPYVAYSHAWRPLPGTRRETFWGGAAVTFSF